MKLLAILRWDILQLNRACKPNSLENSNVEKLLVSNQQPLLVLVAALHMFGL